MPAVPSIDLAIDLKSLTKVYANGVQALDQLSMRVKRGEIYGLLGPNGAGKSTLIKCLTGLVHPSSCRGTVLGYPVGDPAVNHQLGYLPENATWPEHLTAGQVLEFAGRLHGLTGRERSRRTADLLQIAGLEAWQHDAPRPLAGRAEPLAKRHGRLAALQREQWPRGDWTVARQFVKHQKRVDERRHQRHWRR